VSAEVKKEIELEIAYVLFIDIVGYSKFLIDQQRRLLELLNEIVRGTEQFRKAEEVCDAEPQSNKLRRAQAPSVLGCAPRRSAVRENRRLPRAETVEDSRLRRHSSCEGGCRLQVCHLQAARLPTQQQIVASLAPKE